MLRIFLVATLSVAAQSLSVLHAQMAVPTPGQPVPLPPPSPPRTNAQGLPIPSAPVVLYNKIALPTTAATVARAPVASPPADGQKIIIYGDATVQDGLNAREGFAHLVGEAFQQQNIQLVFLRQPPGYSSRDLLANFKKAVLAQQPDWLLFGCGYYDANANINPAQFKTNVGQLLDQAAGLKVVLLTPIMNGEDPASPPNQKMAPYCDAIRALARERNLPFADINALMQAEVASIRIQVAVPFPGLLLTNDAAHLNGLGHEMVAAELLRLFGFTPAQLAQARDTWLDLPDGMDLLPRGTVSVRQYLQLRKMAADEGISVNQLLLEMLQKDVMHLLVNGTPPKKKKHE